MNIQPRSMISTAGLVLAALSMPVLADGVPGARQAKSALQRDQAVMGAARKPNDSGVKLTARLDAKPQVGRGTPVTLQFDGVTAAEGATAELSVEPGLMLSGSETLALPANKRTSVTVTVVSEREGLSFLNVFITQKGGTSAISVPIQTGTATPVMKSSGTLETTPEGENIITMPAK
jgi:hypothetical protein